MIRTNEMTSFNDEYNVHNGKWGLDNITDTATFDPTTGAIVVPYKGQYRVTGVIVGAISDNSKRAQGYLNLPPDKVNDPSYADPFYHGFQFETADARVSAPFSGLLNLTTYDRFSLYLSKNFAPSDPYARLLFEFVQP